MRSPLGHLALVSAVVAGVLAVPPPIHALAAPNQPAAATKAGFDPATSRRNDRKSSALSDVFDNSDGSVTRRTYPRPVNYRTPDGGWQPVDPSLVRGGDGRLHMRANSLGVSFAGETTTSPAKPLARAAERVDTATPLLANVDLPTGQSVGYQLSGAAPVTPVVDGAKAVYAGVLPHTDVQLEAFDGGLDETMILHSSDAPASWTFPLTLSGLTPALTGTGGIELRDDSGTAVAWIPHGYMEDSKVDPYSGAPAQSTGITYRLEQSGGRTVLRVDADRAWLNAPERVFPVRVDPTTTTGTTGDVFVDNDSSTGNHNGDNLPIGTYDSGTTKARSFIHLDEFDDDGLLGKRITKAQLKLYLTWAYSCTVDQPFYVRTATQKWTVADLTAGKWPGPTYSAPIGSLTVTSPGAACTNREADRAVGKWVTVPLSTGAFNGWTAGGPNYGLVLTASESASTAWKRFTSANFSSGKYKPMLEVTYSDNVVPVIDQRGPANNAVVRTLTPELQASGHDPDAYPNKGLTYGFTVTSADGKTTVASSAAVASTWTVPAGKLAWNTAYKYTVKAYDKVGYSAASSAYTFTTANTAADLPAVSGRGVAITDEGTTSSTVCVTGDSRPQVKTVTPQLWATFTHPRLTTVNAEFQYAYLDGTLLGTETVTAAPLAKPVAVWVPQERLVTDGSYMWRVRARNDAGTDAGAFTSWCEFTVRADLVVAGTSTQADDYTEATDPDPDGADTAPEEPPGNDTIPGVDDQDPYVPSADDGQSYDETDADESDVDDDGEDVTEDGTYASLSASDPANSIPDVAVEPGAGLPCPLGSDPATVTDGAAVNVADGAYSCPTADAPADETDSQPFDGSDVDVEQADDTTDAEARVATAAAKSAVGSSRNTPLPDACRYAPRNRWMVGRYDACYSVDKSWVFATVINGRVQVDGVLSYSEFRYARQSPSKGTWDFHVYLRVNAITGGYRVAGARATSVYLWCNGGRCSTHRTPSSGSVTAVGNWIQFSGSLTYSPAKGKRISQYAKLSFRIARPDDIGVIPEVVTSNWVRCDRALKGASSTGCVVPNVIPTLRYSRSGRYPDLANHIYAAQTSQLPGRPGAILDGGSGSSRKLTRLYDANLRKKNGSRACPSGYRTRVGAPANTTCDEYPFRSTYQGAYTVDRSHNLPRTFSFCHLPRNSKTGSHGYSHCFINGKQNEAGGRWVGRFYGTGSGGQRLLDGDGFYVGIS